MKEVHCVISGFVQMVLFRNFVQRKAVALGLVGTVRNLKDGSVEVVAQGSKEKLLALIKHLEKGPLLAQVQDVAVTWREPGASFDNFSIIS